MNFLKLVLILLTITVVGCNDENKEPEGADETTKRIMENKGALPYLEKMLKEDEEKQHK